MAERGWRLVAAGAAGAGAVLATRRWRGGTGSTGGTRGTDRTGGRRARAGNRGTPVQAVTVLGPLDEVARAWEEQVGTVDGVDADVRFAPAPGGRGTEIRVRLDEDPAGGMGERLRGETPAERVRRGLRTFKSQVECGQVVTTEGQPSGRGPAQEAATRAVTDRFRSWGPA